MSRGMDGLTIEELRSSRALWWDDDFTRVFLDAIPDGPGTLPGTLPVTLIEIGCGLGQVAHALLPHRPGLRYVGFDIDVERIGIAAQELAEADYGDRAEVRWGNGERLPLEDGSADIVLTSMTLQHVGNVPAVLREARRVLAANGLVVAVEPDQLGQRFYFDGLLNRVTAAFAALMACRRAARQPSDLAIGPRIPLLLREAGFREVQVRAHCVQATAYCTAGKVASDLRDVADTLAAGIDGGLALHQACRDSVNDWLDEVGSQRQGQFAMLVPVFVSRGYR